MAIALTLLYILSVYLTVPTLFGGLVEYRLELVIAILALIASLPGLPLARLVRSPQSFAIAGLSAAIVASIAVTGWFGGGITALYGFSPVIFGFFLVAANCRSKLHLQLVTLTLFVGSVYYIVQGGLAAYGRLDTSPFAIPGDIPRIQGLGHVNDPNDFSQVLVSLLPCLFFFWRRGNLVMNAITVWVPALILVVGMYLTHSRGAAVALMAVLILSVRRKIGSIPALIGGGVLFVISLAVGWGGGRDVSVEAGSDRIDAWYTGIQLFKTHPLFGVGISHFSDYYYITAHNSIVVCAAELGSVGFLFWVLFVFCTAREGMLLGKNASQMAADGSVFADERKTYDRVSRLEPATPLYATHAGMLKAANGFPGAAVLKASYPYDVPALVHEESEDEEIRRMARILVISIAGFLVSGWFLSRALSIWLFIYGGMMFALVGIAEEKKIAPPKASVGTLLFWTLGLAVGLLATVSLLVRFASILMR